MQNLKLFTQSNIFKRIFLLLFLASGLSIYGQTKKRCSVNEYHQILLSQDAQLQNRVNTIEQERQVMLNSSNFIGWRQSFDPSFGPTSDPYIKIPVVIHIIGNVAVSSVTTQKVLDQLHIINDDYNDIDGLNGESTGENTHIQFCLASSDPNGNPTNGIVQISGNFKTYYNTVADNQELKSKSNWPAKSYLNIWVTQTDPTILGWGTPPSWYMNTPNEYLDGVVCNVNNFGLNPSDAQYGSGRTLTHEIGHWLDLLHPWGLNASVTDCSGTDLVDDTPYCNGDFYSSFANGCNSYASCQTVNTANNLSSTRQIENYMDYSDDKCMSKFTAGQMNRMWTTLFGIRKDIMYSKGGGCLAPPTCEDGIKNGLETDVDCGGNCHPCNSSSGSTFDKCMTTKFRINGQSSAQSFVNVCTSNIVISPYGNITSECDALNQKWLFRTSRSEKLCTQTDNMWQAASKQYSGDLNNKCLCFWLQLFISIVECDQNKVVIPGAWEAMHWVYIFDNDPSMMQEKYTMKNLDLNNYLPPGFAFNPGKYYKIKIASYQYGTNAQSDWVESNGYIRTFQDDLTVDNMSAYLNPTANNIIIKNSTVPINSTKKAIAKTSIVIQPNTVLFSGHYYIDPALSCSTVARVITPNDEPTPQGEAYNHSDKLPVSNASSEKPFSKEKKLIPEDLEILKISPNPATDQIKIEFNLVKQGKVSGVIYNLNSSYEHVFINAQTFHTGNNLVVLTCNDFKQGVYFIKISIDDKIIVKKIIITAN